MSGRKFNFSITQLLLITALCGLVAGLVAASRRESSTRYLHGLAFSPDGRLLAALGATDSIVVWDLSRDPPTRADLSMAANVHYGQPCTFIDESTVAMLVSPTTPTYSVEILFWDVIRDVRKKSIVLRPVPSVVAFSSDGRRAATVNMAAAGGGAVDLWDLTTGKQYGTITPNNTPHLAAISDDGKTLTVVPLSADSSSVTAEIWSVDPPKLLKTLDAGPALVGSALSSDGRWLLTNAGDSKPLWNLTTDASMPLESDTWYHSSQFSSDGKSLATVEFDGVDVWDTSTGKLRGRIADAGSQYGYYPNTAAISPDGKLVAVATCEDVSLWDAHTFRRVRTLSRSRRMLSIVMFSTGFIAWAAVWGVVGRRRRQRESPDVPVPAASTKLPASIDAALNPGRFWLRFLLTFAILAAILAWCLAGLVQYAWDLAYWSAFAATFAMTLFVLPTLYLLGHWVWRLTVWPSKGTLERNVKRATEVAGMPGRRVEFGPVTAIFFGSSQFDLTLQQEYEAVLERFSKLAGEPVEPRDPLLVLVFERPEIFDAYFQGHMPLGGAYWTFRGRQIIMCEQTSLDRLTEPRRVLRILFGHYFWEQYKRFLAEPWLQMIVSRLAATDSEPDVLCRDHRAIRVWQQRDAASIEPGLLTMPQCEAARLMLDTHQPENFRRSTCYGYQMASLADFLAGPHSGKRREQFQAFLRDLKRGERSVDAFVRHFGHGFDQLMREWHAWALTQEIRPYDPPPPIVRRHIKEQLVPLIADKDAPLDERSEAIRHMGAGAYPTCAYVLIDLLRSGDASALRDEAVWALERISGETHGDDAAAWQEWWERSLDQQEPHDDVPVAEPVEAVLVADEEPPVLAELADEPDSSIGDETGE